MQGNGVAEPAIELKPSQIKVTLSVNDDELRLLWDDIENTTD